MLDGKERRKKERKKKKNKIKIFAFNFLDCEKKSWNSGAIFYIRIAKGFHLQYKSFASLCCVYLGAASVPQVQDAILNPLNPYLITFN